MGECNLKGSSECLYKSDKNCGGCILAKHNVAALIGAFGANANKNSIKQALANSPLLNKYTPEGLNDMAAMRKRQQNYSVTPIARPKQPHIIVPSHNHIKRVARAHGIETEEII